MATKMTAEEIRAKKEENIAFLNTLNLPKPEEGEKIREYSIRAQNMLDDIIVPADYEGDLFYWLEFYDVGEYLDDRFGIVMDEIANRRV